MSASPIMTTVSEPTTANASAPNRGLHGHPFDSRLLIAALSEAVGTFVLGIAIMGTAVAGSLARPVGTFVSPLSVPLVAGIALALLAASLGPISGAHVNPAVTLSLAIGRRFPCKRVPVYIVSQFVGAVGAALLVWWFYGPRARTIAHLGAPRPSLGVDAGRVFVAEAIATFVLALVIVAVAQEREQPSAVAFVAIGAALVSAFLISGPVGGAGVNPAGVFASMLVAGIFTDWWVYVLAPLVGGAGAALLYGVLISAPRAPRLLG